LSTFVNIAIFAFECHLSGVNARQAKFVALIRRGKSQHAAYVAAGFKARGKSAREAAARLAAKPEIAAALAKTKEEVIESAKIDVAWLIAKLIDEVNRGKAASARLRAIELLGDNLGAWTPKEKPIEPLDISKLSESAKRSALTYLRGLFGEMING
jgi:hypothetical protein